jgi:hypothetical protein
MKVVMPVASGDFVLLPPSANGWTSIRPIEVELRTESIDRGPVLHLRLSGDPETDRAI